MRPYHRTLWQGQVLHLLLRITPVCALYRTPPALTRGIRGFNKAHVMSYASPPG